MERRIPWLGCLLLLLPLVACQEDTPFSPPTDQMEQAQSYVDPGQVALAIMEATGWPAADEDGNPVEVDSAQENGPDKCQLIFVGRQPITDNVAHYEFRLRVGPGQHDVIGLHRVVTERRPCVPIRSAKSIFLQHGDAVGFKVFLFGAYSSSTPDEQSLAVYLAAHEVDVWGIDQPMMLLPGDLGDTSFLAEWGFDYALDSLKKGITVARQVRLLSGNGLRKMCLLGYSSGVRTAYGLADAETQMPPGRRQIAGLVQMDGSFISDAETAGGWCNYASYYRDLYESGVYVDDFGQYFLTFGNLATSAPDAPCEVPGFEGLTNLQAALAFGVFPDPFLGSTFHFCAGTFDADGLPTGLQYTTVAGYLDFLLGASPIGSTRFSMEYMSISCGDTDVPWDDHLGEITVPICCIGAGGGEAEHGLYTASLTGSVDVTPIVVSLQSPEDAALDIGHVDILTAAQAQDLVWLPLLSWIVEHAPGGPH